MTQLTIFKDGDHEVQLIEDVEHDTVWASQQQIAEIFSSSISNISEHIKQI